MTRILITGGVGFIGSGLCHYLAAAGGHAITVIDKLTYAANRASVSELEGGAGFELIVADICEQQTLNEVFDRVQPEQVFHLAAESHVDRSIAGSAPFLHTNVVGSHTLLEVARAYYEGLSGAAQNAFRFVHVSTDEVYGSLGPEGLFTEASPYNPSSPYSASKAAADQLALAWHRTYGLPVIVTHCSNNYGPRQFPEKLIPHMIARALAGKSLPVYGDGSNVRDWLHVEDHVRGLVMAAKRGHPGQRYNFGGSAERSNLDLVHTLCDLLDSRRPGPRPKSEQIEFVKDRLGHDYRYAVDVSRAKSELGWQAGWDFTSGLEATVDWYLENEAWWHPLMAQDLS